MMHAACHSSTSSPAPAALVYRAFRSAALALALLLTSGETLFAQNAATPVQPPPLPDLSHFRVTWMHSPSNRAIVSWTTPVPGTDHTVYYDLEPRQGKLSTYAQKATALPSRKYTLPADDTATPAGWAQDALLEELAPATTYYFVVVSDKKVSREFHFVTAPADDRPFKLLYGADSRRRRPDLSQPQLTRRNMNRMIASLVEEHPDIVALAHGGDYCSYSDWPFLRDWLSDHELTITRSGRILPLIPARGNHEGRKGFDEVFYSPELTTPYYYSIPLSARATLVTLNTNASKAGDQRDWLEAELARERAAPGKWVVVQYHVPAYPSVKPIENGAQQRQHWVPLFERYQVDLVCEADDHMLKRTVPIFEDKHDPERGIIYIGDGGLGVSQRVPDTTRWYLKSPGFATPAHHVHLLEFQNEELRVTAIGLDRQPLDRFVVKARAVAVPAGAVQ